MLSRKRLEDAARCGKTDCDICEMKDLYDGQMEKCVEAAAETALALADMCKRLEWEGALAGEFCPMCKCQKRHGHEGHTKDCELSALLKGLEVENANKI
jgi:hypothetical protein